MQNTRVQYLIKEISQNNDEIAFEELFRAYYPGLVSFTDSLLNNSQVSEEVCIDVMYKLWENRTLLPTIRNLSSYLYVAAKHAAISYTRSKGYNFYKSKIPLHEMGETMVYEIKTLEDNLIDKETLVQINAAINSLPPRCRLIFKLIKEDGLKYAEVASLLEISVKTVENQLVIAIKKLTEILRESYKGYQKKYS